MSSSLYKGLAYCSSRHAAKRTLDLASQFAFQLVFYGFEPDAYRSGYGHWSERGLCACEDRAVPPIPAPSASLPVPKLSA